MSLQKGQIVNTFLTPPHDPNRGKERPALVLEVVPGAETCEVIAVSSRLDIGDPDYFVAMPFSPDGKCKSGLTRKCVAKVFWHDSVEVNNCERIGYVPAKKLIEVKAKFDDYLESQKLAVRAPHFSSAGQHASRKPNG